MTRPQPMPCWSTVRRRAGRLLDARRILAAAALLVAPGLTTMADGWELPDAAGPPGYAAVIPSRTNLNIESVVLACERADDGNVLQLQLYPSGEDVALRVIGAPVWSYGRHAEIGIDDKVFRADLLFADDHAVIADETRGRFPMLSEPLLDAMAAGRTMSLRLAVDVETISTGRGVNGYATVDLRAGQGGRAIAALRRCSGPSPATTDADRQAART